MRTPSSRTAVVALTAALALTSLDLAPASAANIAGRAQAKQISTIDLSARRRHHRGDAIMLGAIASVFGVIAAAAAARRYRERYYYSDEPYYYAPYGSDAPYAYVTPPVYGPSFRFHGGHHGHQGHHGHDTPYY